MSNPVIGINASTPPTSAPTASPSNGLTQADFLKIMVAEFTQQDPLSSGSGSGGSSGTSDYVNQLMSMTNLTTMQTMSGQEAQQLAASLPGSTVQVDDNGAMGGGVVQSARVDSSSGGVFFTVSGKEYPSADLYSISQTSAETAAAAAAANNTPATTTP